MKRARTPTFLLELPLQVNWSQQRQVRAHLEAARRLYNALRCFAMKRLRHMRNDPAWAKARAIPRSKKQERAQAFSALRKQYHFSEYDLHEYAKLARVSWIADHIESTMAQTLASRAYQAANRVCVGKARRVRFRSSGRGIDSVEGKRNDTGMHFVLDPNAGDGGFLIWNTEVIPAIIDWLDPVVQHGMHHRIKYVRLVRRRASSPHAQGTDKDGNRYYVQLVLEGHAFVKPKHEEVGKDIIGLDIGPSTLAMVPREGKADLVTFREKLAPASRKKRRLQRKMDRQRRANNPENYDEQGRVKKGRRRWKESKRYQATRRQHANTERKLAAQGTRLHGHLAHRIAQRERYHDHHRNNLVQSLAKAVWSEHRTARTGDVCSAFDSLSPQKLAAPSPQFLLPGPNCLTIARSRGSSTRSRLHNAGIHALVASGRCKAISMRRSRLSYLE